nr:ras-related protein Rab-10-like [Halyomorpha halys]
MPDDFVALSEAQEKEEEIQRIKNQPDLKFKSIEMPGTDRSILCETSLSKARPYRPTEFRGPAFDKIHNLSHPSVDIFQKTIKIRGIKSRLGIRDTTGKHNFKLERVLYYRNAEGVLLVYDITSSKSYENIIKLYIEVSVYVNAFAVFLLVGNKRDLEIKRTVEEKKTKRFAKSHGFMFMETSASENTNIDALFQLLIEEIYNRDIGRIHILENESTQIKNESDLRNVKPEPNHHRVRSFWWEGLCTWKWK